jgi:hypothetical protein
MIYVPDAYEITYARPYSYENNATMPFYLLNYSLIFLCFCFAGTPDPLTDSHSLPHKAAHQLQRQPLQVDYSAGGQVTSGGEYYKTGPPSGALGERTHQQQPNVVACLAAVICIASLFLPTEGETTIDTIFHNYPWLCLSVNQKLVFSYVLGLVTMAILRTN